MAGTFSFSKAPKQSLKTLAYESIKTAIVKGDLAPGERLLETEIASQMGISRGPVREAIRQLDQEGLTYSHPHRGMIVLEMNSEETEKVFVPTRRILEEYVARNAYLHLTNENYQYLESIIKQMESASQEDNFYEMIDLDMKFHSHLIEQAASPSICALWNNIKSRIHSRLLLQGIAQNSLNIAQEHKDYLSCIREGDIDKIREHLHYHIY